jgi:hypothetical protein
MKLLKHGAPATPVFVCAHSPTQVGEATKLHSECVEAHCQVLGSNHPLTLNAKMNLANVLLYGDNDDVTARRLLEEVVAG